MATDVILGIHSNVLENASYTEGHAWITVTRNGYTKYYGLWPDEHSSTVNNGPGMDIREGLEKNSKPKASRYYKLSTKQIKLLDKLLLENVTWGYTHNCSSWAHDVIYKVVKEDVDADDFVWFSETPQELGRNIKILEKGDPTTAHKPRDMSKNANTQSSTSSK
jgi:hypothetical protein